MKIPKQLIRILPIVCVIAAIVVAILPILRPGFFVTDDGDWMVIRLSAFYQSLVSGQFPVRYLGRLNHSYGYPVANFLYPGFMYIGSLIHLVGVPFETTVEMILAGSLAAGAVGMYIFLRKRFGALASALGAISYVLSPYLLFDVYRRGSVGEVLALGIVPFLFASIERGRAAAMGILIALLIISHNSLALMVVPVIAVYIYVKKKKDLWVPFVLGIMMASFFWFPAVWEKGYVRFDKTVVSDPSLYYASITGLFSLISIVHAAGFVMAQSQRRKEDHVAMVFFSIVFAAAFVMATPLSGWLWDTQAFARLFQFPYRFLSLTILAGAWLLAYTIHALNTRRILMYVLVPIAVIVMFFQAVEHTRDVDYVTRPSGYYSTNEATTTVADEYMPVWVGESTLERATDRIIFHQGRGTIDAKTATHQRIDAIVTAQDNSIMQLNMIYYPGWGATVDGVPVELLYDNPNAFMRFAVPVGTHHVFAEFRETIPRFVADMVSFLSLLILGYWVLFMQKQNNEKT